MGGDRLLALTGNVTEVLAGHLNHLPSAQRNYREAVNLYRTALVKHCIQAWQIADVLTKSEDSSELISYGRGITQRSI